MIEKTKTKSNIDFSLTFLLDYYTILFIDKKTIIGNKNMFNTIIQQPIMSTVQPQQWQPILPEL